MRCMTCGVETSGSGSLCRECSGQASLRCHVCSAPLSPGAKFCPQCAHSVSQLYIEAEWRDITVMFCEVAGATERAVQLDPEDWYDVLSAHQQRCADAIFAFG